MPLSLLLSLAFVRFVTLSDCLPRWRRDRGFLTPLCAAKTHLGQLLLAESLLLSHLLLELFRDLALEAVKRGSEVVQDVGGAETVSRRVVRRVHRVLNHEVVLVHLRQLIE